MSATGPRSSQHRRMGRHAAIRFVSGSIRGTQLRRVGCVMCRRCIRQEIPSRDFAQRGRLMASFAAENAGAMLAVHASAREVENVLGEDSLDIVIANRNSPSQCILSGATAEIARAETAFQRRRLRTTRLPVDAAFHSPQVARAIGPFGEAPGKSAVWSFKSARVCQLDWPAIPA